MSTDLDTRIALLSGVATETFYNPFDGGPDAYWLVNGAWQADPPEFSASLDAQQEILGGLRKRGWRFLIDYNPMEVSVKGHRSGLRFIDDRRVSAEGNDFALAMAEAICAALESEAKG